MKFLCDVHIAYKLKNFFLAQGFEALHVNELLNKSDTCDGDIGDYADKEGCILITKDFDFVDFYYLRQSPKKIIKINLGNIATDELIVILMDVLPFIQKVLHRTHFLIELNKDGIYTIDQNQQQ